MWNSYFYLCKPLGTAAFFCFPRKLSKNQFISEAIELKDTNDIAKTMKVEVFYPKARENAIKKFIDTYELTTSIPIEYEVNAIGMNDLYHFPLIIRHMSNCK